MDALVRSPFGRLAVELRNQIYEYAFANTVITTVSYDYGKRLGLQPDGKGNVIESAIGLLRTCKVIRAETLQMFFYAACTLLKRLDPVAVKSIRHFAIDVGHTSYCLSMMEHTLLKIAENQHGLQSLLSGLETFGVIVRVRLQKTPTEYDYLQLEMDAYDLDRSTERYLAMVKAAAEMEKDSFQAENLEDIKYHLDSFSHGHIK